jgi:hypothetical protein
VHVAVAVAGSSGINTDDCVPSRTPSLRIHALEFFDS